MNYYFISIFSYLFIVCLQFNYITLYGNLACKMYMCNVYAGRKAYKCNNLYFFYSTEWNILFLCVSCVSYIQNDLVEDIMDSVYHDFD